MNPIIENNLEAGDILISAAVGMDVNVDYLQEVSVPVSISNKANVPILIESIALQFNANEFATNQEEARVIHKCEGGGLKPRGSNYWNVRVKPDLFFEFATNCYSISVTYRREEQGRLGDSVTVHKPAGIGNFLIIKRPPTVFGKVFISYKDDEDKKLANLLLTLARNAGFDPYMAPPDLRPGAELWNEKIIPAIQESSCVFVIWTSETSKGTGVEREIELTREFGKDEILLLENGIDVPELFKKRQFREKERTRFDRSAPARIFAEIVVARREMIQGK